MNADWRLATFARAIRLGTLCSKVAWLVMADLQILAVAEWLQSFNSVRGPMERLEFI